MTPFQRKIKSLGHAKIYPKNLDKVPERLPDEEILELVIKLRELKYNQRSKEFIIIRDKIIYSHMKLAVSIASRFGYKFKNKIDDLVGEAFLVLVRYVGVAAIRLNDNNITPYLKSALHGELGEYINEDKTVHMPGRTVRYFGEKGRYISLEKIPFKITLLNDTPNKGEDTDAYEYNNAMQNSYIIPETSDDKTESEVLEILDKVTPNLIEKRVIELRAQGYTYQEIGPKVGCSKSSISIMVQNIEERFNKEYKKI